MVAAAVLVHLEAACSEQICDVVIAEEGHRYFEAAAAPERPLDVVDADDCVADDGGVAP